MKFLRGSLKLASLLILLFIILVWIYSQVAQPQYSGELKLNNISNEVTVYFDDIGVPHINAQNQKDAYVALGYVHAQDRLWQMELMRRIAPGRLSEILGKEVSSVDQFFAGLGIEEAANKTIASLDKNAESYVLMQAYLEGVNQFIEEGETPLEFTLLGINKETYTVRIFTMFSVICRLVLQLLIKQILYLQK